MTCLRCEVARAKLTAFAMVNVGKSLDDVAAYLSERYGVKYFVDVNVVMRSNNPVNIPIIKG